MSDCDKIRLELDAYIGNQLPEGAMNAVARHLEPCPDCHSAMARMKRVSALLREWPGIEPRNDFIDSVNRQIDEISGTTQPEEGFIYRFRYQLGAAAALFLSLIVWLSVHKQPEGAYPVSVNQGTVAVSQGAKATASFTPGAYYIGNDSLMQTDRSKAVISLPDKTRIEMDRRTALNITNQDGQSRGHIILRQGGIYLSVANDKDAKPVYVETEAGRIKVIGTKLRVNNLRYQTSAGHKNSGIQSENDGIRITTVSLDEGAAQVEWRNFSYPLNPGESMAFSISIKPTRFELPSNAGRNGQINRLLELINQSRERYDIDNGLAAEAILSGFGQGILPDLMDMLKNQPNGEYNAILLGRIIGRLGSEELYPELADIVKETRYNPARRTAAAEAMLNIDQIQGARALLTLFNSASNTETLKLCLSAIRNRSSIGPENTAQLIKILVAIIKKGENRDNPLFTTALESLKMISDISGLELLYELLDHEFDYRVALSAGQAIARLGGPSELNRVLARFTELSEGKDELARLAAIKALIGLETGQNKQRLALRLLDIGLASTDPKIKLACLETALILGDQQVFELFKNIVSLNNSDLTLQAIQKIARLSASDTISGLTVELLASGYYNLINRWKRTQEETYRDLAGQIAHCIEGLKTPRALPVIRGLMASNEPELAISSIRAIANIGEKEDIFTLLKLLDRVTEQILKTEIQTAINTLRTTLDFRDE